MTRAQNPDESTGGRPSPRQTGILAREMENALLAHPEVIDCAVRYHGPGEIEPAPPNCTTCGISGRYPGISFDAAGVCGLCLTYERDKERVHSYFGTRETLLERLRSATEERGASHDCLLLFSGGKDSTYVLYQLVSMGLRVMTFTFDNGFISRAALRNVESVTSALGVEHVTMSHDDQERVFLESLNEHKSVCNGCFRSLLELSTRLAHERGIPSIVTGLSRGQIIDERLSWFHSQGVFDPERIERDLRAGRTVYHRGRIGNEALDSVDVVDFFRYSDVSKEDIRRFLRTHSPAWAEPTDTGFCSSNCMINDVGVYVHTIERGFHNYESPTRWEVRLGHLGREEADGELREPVNTARVRRVLSRLGYADPGSRSSLERHFTGYVVTPGTTAGIVRASVPAETTPPALPGRLVRVADIPRPRGSVDGRALELMPVLDEDGAVPRAPSPSDSSTGSSARRALVPVLPGQRHLLELAAGGGGLGTYAQALLLETEGVGVHGVRRALTELVLLHEALRLRFVREGDQWRQEAGNAEKVLALSRLDLSRHEPEEQTELLHRALRRTRSRADSPEGPRLQAVVVERGGGSVLLLLVLHALVADPGSWRTLLKDLGDLWSGTTAPRVPPSFLSEVERRAPESAPASHPADRAPHVPVASTLLRGARHGLDELCHALSSSLLALFPEGLSLVMTDHTLREPGIVGPLTGPLRTLGALEGDPLPSKTVSVRFDHVGDPSSFSPPGAPFSVIPLEGTGAFGPGGPEHPVAVTSSLSEGTQRLDWWCEPALRHAPPVFQAPTRLLEALGEKD